MKIKRFGIYSANLDPGRGTEPGKVRPVVVVQTNLLNNKHPSTIVCPVTSKIIPGVSVLRVNLDHEDNKLDKPSAILVDQIRAIDNNRFVKQIGVLTQEQMKKMVESLKIVLFE